MLLVSLAVVQLVLLIVLVIFIVTQRRKGLEDSVPEGMHFNLEIAMARYLGEAAVHDPVGIGSS